MFLAGQTLGLIIGFFSSLFHLSLKTPIWGGSSPKVGNKSLTQGKRSWFLRLVNFSLLQNSRFVLFFIKHARQLGNGRT